MSDVIRVIYFSRSGEL